MNDRYTFRGKRTDNGEWVEGYYFYTEGDNKHWIWRCGEFKYEVDPATVGQCTDLRDKNGKLIFEGDVLKCRCFNKKYDLIGHSDEPKYVTKITQMEYWNSYVHNGYRLKFAPKNQTMMVAQSALSTMEVEIIGNVHDNPELLTA